MAAGVHRGSLPRGVASRRGSLRAPERLFGARSAPAYDPLVEERLSRQAQNEALLRTVNEQVVALSQGAAGWADSEHEFDFTCECGKLDGCGDRVSMTLAEYELVRSQRDRFAVVPGHETDDLERVVQRNERFAIVDKRDEYEHLVE